jgi:multidrug resistance protein MdtO
MNPSALLDFLRRELAPTPGRGSATFRLTLACLVVTIPILTHRIPHAPLIMFVMFLITQEDTAATVIGSILGIVGLTIGLGLALLAWEISLDIPWLRLCFLAVFLFGGLFLKRVLTFGAVGTAIGLPAAMCMILPDIVRDPEALVEFVLWVWWCGTLGVSVNAGVQLLLSPGDPLKLLRRELDTRLLAVEQSLRRLAGNVAMEPPAASLDSLGIVGMSRPLALLKSASIIHRWARERREELAAIVTLVDRLVTSAIALEAVAPVSDGEIRHERLLDDADACDRTRRAFAELRLPSPGEWVPLAAGETSGSMSPLADMERTLDEIVLALPGRFDEPGASGAGSAEKPKLFLPDAFDNPEYVRFAIKGSLAALICYVIYVGYDYPVARDPGYYTAVITCFVVSLSTVGASNQKGILRFGGAALGGGMGLIALMYLLPNVEGIGGFWLVFGAGTAVAAWLNFGTPRISYSGVQAGLAFYKAVLQGFAALSATVIRDRLIGIFFGLTVFGIVEHLLWPVRAADRMRARLAEIMRLLAELARTATSSAASAVSESDVDSWRRRISQKVEDVQGLIESSKFELGVLNLSDIQKFTGDAQIIFILLLSLARESQDVTLPDVVRAAALELDDAIAVALLAMETRVASGSQPAVLILEGVMEAFERSIAAGTNVPGETEADRSLTKSLALYRALVAAIRRLSSEPLNGGAQAHEFGVLTIQGTED